MQSALVVGVVGRRGMEQIAQAKRVLYSQNLKTAKQETHTHDTRDSPWWRSYHSNSTHRPSRHPSCSRCSARAMRAV